MHDQCSAAAAARRAGLRAGTATLVATILTVAAAAQTTGDQAQLPGGTFRVETSGVEVDVTVTDRDGNLVGDLTPEEFQVLEDGRPQEISAFAVIDLPITVTPAGAPGREPGVGSVEPDVRSNERAAEGRLYLLVLDDLQTNVEQSEAVRSVAREFITRYLGPDDIAAVIHTSGGRDSGQELTTSRRLLLASVEKFVGRKLKSSILSRIEEYDRLQIEQLGGNRADLRLDRIPDPLEADRAAQAQAMLRTVRGIGTLLAGVRGRRKAIVLVSEGVDYDMAGGVSQTSSGLTTFTTGASAWGAEVRRGMLDAIQAVVRSSAAIYAIDPRGLADPGDLGIEVGQFIENPLYGLGPTAFLEEIRRAQDTLHTLAEETGGSVSVGSNDFTGIFERIVRDNSAYYMLGYEPTNSRRDGKFRRIEVRVTRPGMTVRARKGYVAPSDRDANPPALATEDAPVPALRDALASPVPATGVRLRVQAVAFQAGEGAVLVGVEADAGRFKFAQDQGLYTDTLFVGLVARDGRGEIRARDSHTVDMQLKPETYEAVRTRGLRMLFRLDLPPGRYQIRAAAYEAGAGGTGSVHDDVDVPEAKREALAMSGLVLTSTHAARTPTAKPDPMLAGVLPAAPSAGRVFQSDDQIFAYFEVYPPASAGLPPTEVVTSLVDSGGRAVFRSEETLAGGDAPQGYGWVVPIPLVDVAPGSYVLRVEAMPRTRREDALRREVPIAVRAASAP